MAAPILIVDDNPVNLFALRTLVEHLGYAVEAVSTGEHAVQLACAGPFAAILLDLMMPNMTGYVAARQIRACHVKTPIVAITALDDTEVTRALCDEAGIDELLVKPVDGPSLAAKLARFTTLQDGAGVTRKLLNDIYGTKNLTTILHVFFEVSRTLMDQLEQALKAHQDDEARRVVHEIKAASSQMYSGELTKLCRDIELARQQNDWPKMVALYKELNKALISIVAVLSKD
jgi:CheY-like chemotaxis protein